MSERVRADQRYRIIVEKRPGKRLTRNWWWTVEEWHYHGHWQWELETQGRTFTRAGALDSAIRHTGRYMNVHRVEALLVAEWSYERREPKPSPLHAEYVS